MSIPPNNSIEQYFGELPDPRSGQNVQHKLMDIVTIAICAIICGADNWVDIEQFGKAKQGWLSSFLELPHGIPSHDTFARVFRRLKPEAFQASFQNWTQVLAARLHRQGLAVDGKQLRGSKDGVLDKDGIYMVSAWAQESHLVLAQDKVDEHSNEITAIPRLLELLDIEDSIITLDAMGCQTAIAQTIVEQGADYVMAVKGNQGTLFEDLSALFDTPATQQTADYHRTITKDHGRIEIRQCWALADPEEVAHINDYKTWEKLRSVVKVQAERRLPGQEPTFKTRYFISSLPPQAKHMLQVIRGHWGIENGLHWVLDIAFREDESRARKDHAPQNLAILRHIAVNLLKQESSLKVGVKAKRLRAGWDEHYLLKVLAVS